MCSSDLADMHRELLRQADALFGPGTTRSVEAESPAPGAEGGQRPTILEVDPGAQSLKLSSRQQRQLWDHVGAISNFWETLAEIESGTVARLWLLAQERSWEMIFLTKRPPSAGDSAQLQTQRWLAANGFRYPSVYVVQGSRGRIAAALDLHVVVDDRAENCLDVVMDSSARAFLVWRDRSAPAPAVAEWKGIQLVRSMDECIDRLVDASSGSPGFVTRMKRLLGGGRSPR